MNFIGQYHLELKNEKLEIPWEIDPYKKYIWIVLEHSDGTDKETMCFILGGKAYEELTADVIKHPNDYRFVAKGRLVTDDCNMWTVPDAVIQYLGNEKVVLIGMDTRIEIYSKEVYDDETKFYF